MNANVLSIAMKSVTVLSKLLLNIPAINWPEATYFIAIFIFLWMLVFCVRNFFFNFCVCILSKKLFLSFLLFFDCVSDFRNRILTNQKVDLVIRTFQWNCLCSCAESYVNEMIRYCRKRWDEQSVVNNTSESAK